MSHLRPNKIPVDQWLAVRQVSRNAIPPQLKSWLLDRGSLTDRLKARSHGAFRVQCLAEGWARPHRHERAALGLPDRQNAWVREVLLLGNEQPWVYARSVVPARSLQGSLAYLKRIGTRPLGALLFSDPTMRRGEIEIACLEPDKLPLPASAPAWGRRSVFYLTGKPLLVSEVFLPTFSA